MNTPPPNAYPGNQGAFGYGSEQHKPVDDSMEKLIKVKIEPELKMNSKYEADQEKKFDGPKLRIETLASEGAAIRPSSMKTPTTPSPILHKDTQLIPVEQIDPSIRDPRMTKGFISSSIYHDIASKPALNFPICTQATSNDGTFISCSELIPWRFPAKVDFAKYMFNKFSLDALPSLTMAPEAVPPKPTAPARPTDPRKRSSAASGSRPMSTSQSPTQKPIKIVSPPVLECTISPTAVAGSFANSPTSFPIEEQANSPASSLPSPTFPL